jgi:hypothetical protein
MLTIEGFDPDHGNAGTQVTIKGSGFQSDNNNPLALSVSFNGTEAATPTIESDTQMTVTVPQDATTGPISVRGDNNDTATSSTVFEIDSDAIKVTSFAPNFGPVGKRVQILGDGFDLATGVKFGTTRAAQWGKTSKVLMWANVPQGATTNRIYVSSSSHAPVASPLKFTVTPNLIVRTEQVQEAQATPLEKSLISAWNALFQNGTLNTYISQHFATLGLPDTNAGTVGNVDLCYVPGVEISPIPKNDAALTLSGMSFTGLASIAQNGTPTFYVNDSQVKLPATVSNLVVTGSFRLDQTCCTPLFFTCAGNFPTSQSGTFTYTVPSSALTIAVAVANKPGAAPTITVTGLDFNFMSTARVDVPDPNPSWLHWLEYVSGYIRTADAINGALQSHVGSAIQGSPLAGQVQTILNQVLSSGSPVVA